MPEEDKDLLSPEDFEEKEDNTENEDTEDDGGSEDSEYETDDTSVEDDAVGDAKTESDSETKNETKTKKNAEFAKKRREAEQREREDRERKIRDEANLEAVKKYVKTNPYTNEPIQDEDDLAIYEIQKSLDEEGKDPIEDLASEIARRNRESRAKAKAENEQETAKAKQYEEDVKAFRQKYPNVDTKELAENSEFMEFAKDKVGRWTTAEIYEAFTAKAEREKAKKESVVEKGGKAITKTPSATGSGKVAPKSVNDMTPAEFKEYWKNKYGE